MLCRVAYNDFHTDSIKIRIKIRTQTPIDKARDKVSNFEFQVSKFKFPEP